MLPQKIPLKAAATSEELLQGAERRGAIELRLEWYAKVPMVGPGVPESGPLVWRRLPKTRATMIVRGVDAAYAVMRGVDQKLAELMGVRLETSEGETDG